MLDVLQQLLAGFVHVLAPTNLLALVVGLIVGMLVAVLPGLTLVMGVVLALPFTYGMAITPSIILLTAMYVSGTYGGAITSILFRIPGEPMDVPLLWDGYSMARAGDPAQALGWTLFAALTGGLITATVMVTLAVPFAKIALSFDSPEYFSIVLFGFTSVVALGGGSLANAFISLFFGMLVATVGVDEIYGVDRFTFGSDILRDGIGYLPVMVGAYGLGEVLVRLGQGFASPPVSGKGRIATRIPSIAQAWQLRGTFARSSLVGVICGIVPGAGATIASFVSYGVEGQYGKRRRQLGHGIPEGIVAPQVASTASVGGHMVPLLTLGIPGSGATADLPDAVGARLRDFRVGVPRRDRHGPARLLRNPPADQGAVPARGDRVGVRRAVLPDRRVFGAQQHQRPVDDRRVRRRRLPVRTLALSDRADGARLYPRTGRRNVVPDDDDQLPQRLDGVLHATRERRRHGTDRARAAVSVVSAVAHPSPCAA